MGRSFTGKKASLGIDLFNVLKEWRFSGNPRATIQSIVGQETSPAESGTIIG
jgi:hypothetical protein